MRGSGTRALTSFVEFSLDDVRYALPLRAVERVVRAVEITPLPDAPDIILGIINVRGEVVPVADMRRRFHLPPRALAPSDKIVISHAGRRRLSFVADDVHGVAERAEGDITPADAIVPGMEYVRGIAKTGDGLILVQDLDAFLALDEEQSLQRAMQDA